jgi:hypothetical protein
LLPFTLIGVGLFLAARPGIGDASPDTARTPVSLAQQRYTAGDYNGAEDLASKAVGSADSGAAPLVDAALIPSLRLLAAVAAATGDTARAVSMLERSMQIGEALILRGRMTSTETELASLLE